MDLLLPMRSGRFFFICALSLLLQNGSKLTVDLLEMSVAENSSDPKLLGIDVGPHEVVARGSVHHGFQLTADAVSLEETSPRVSE